MSVTLTRDKAVTDTAPPTTLELLAKSAKIEAGTAERQMRQCEEVLKRVKGLNRVVNPQLMSNQELTARVNYRMARARFVERSGYYDSIVNLIKLEKK